MQTQAMAYDRAITVFSPDGRLFQVEYAREAVKRGAPAVGLKFKDGVVLIIDKGEVNKLIETSSIEKIFQIDDKIGCATSGLVADARILVDRARIEAQLNKVYYGEKIPVEMLVKKICDFKQAYTQYGGVRPFGTALLIAGIDDKGPQLFETDPSGALTSYKACSIGERNVIIDNKNVIKEVFEEKYRDGMTQDEGINLCLETLYKATSGELNPNAIEIGIVTKDENFRKLTSEEVQKYTNGFVRQRRTKEGR